MKGLFQEHLLFDAAVYKMRALQKQETRMPKAKHKKVDFGYQQVEESQRQPKVNEIFASVASRYDLMNDLMSAGLHRLWKRRMVKQIPLQRGMHLLDMAGGTGDITFRFLERAKEKGISVSATVSDINAAMLEEGRKRAIDRGILKNIDFKEANAEKLPFADESFEAYSIAFGIRNVTHRMQALKEAYRVLKPGGRFLCLEFSHVENAGLQKLYDAYSFHVIPAVGERITNNRAAYQYLVESIRMFPKADAFAAEMKKAGFAHVTFDQMNGGVVALHSGWKI
jgi:demethylmenaquinone methyltransferase / 2-methoxy-6-polyprenyl-1,4-benzoquinol methylase